MWQNNRIWALDERFHAFLGAEPPQAPEQADPTTDTVAVLTIKGVLLPRSNVFGVSLERATKMFRGLVGDESVKGIVLDIDSPGGAIAGVAEFATVIRQARTVKPIVAVANTLAASAAYHIATAASELVVTPSGEVGSIGVYATHYDFSEADKREGITPTLIKAGKFKAETHPDFPLSDPAKAYLQQQVNEAYDDFINAVAANRGVEAADVRTSFGQGRSVTARHALSLGMVDRIATLDETVARLAARVTATGPAGLLDLQIASLG